MEKIPYKDGYAKAERINIKSAEEKWNIYKLEDGTILRVKTVVASVFRLIEEYEPSGKPIYVIRSKDVVDAEVPEKLYKSK